MLEQQNLALIDITVSIHEPHLRAKYGIKARHGALAQLVARFNGIEEVTSSNLVRSKFYFAVCLAVAIFLLGRL